MVEGGRHEGRQEEEREEGLENVVSVAVVAVESRQSAGLINFVDLGVLARWAEMAGGAGLCQGEDTWGLSWLGLARGRAGLVLCSPL